MDAKRPAAGRVTPVGTGENSAGHKGEGATKIPVKLQRDLSALTSI
jgi:hypothetical protein